MQRPNWADCLIASLMLAAAATAGAGQGDPRPLPHIRREIDGWARAEAERLLGDAQQAQRRRAEVVARCRARLAQPVGPVTSAVLGLVIASAERQSEAPASQRPAPGEVLKRLAALKAQADDLAGRDEHVRAFLAYESLMAACALYRARYAETPGVKAVDWMEGRARLAIGRLPLSARQTGAPLPHAAVTPYAGPLRVDVAPVITREPRDRIPSVIRLDAQPAPPQRAPAWASSAWAPAPVQVGVEPVPVEPVWRAWLESTLREIAGGGGGLSASEVAEMAAWSKARGADPSLVAAMASRLILQPPAAAQGAIVMGAPPADTTSLRRATFDAALIALEAGTVGESDGQVAERAFRLAAELGQLARVEKLARALLERGTPGMAGVLLVKTLLARGEKADAWALLVRIAARPDTFLPRNRHTDELLLRGVAHHSSAGDLPTAERLLAVLGGRGLEDYDRRLFALAGLYRDGGKPGDAERVAKEAHARCSDRMFRADIQTFLNDLARRGERRRPGLSDAQLAAMEHQARTDPHLYVALAREYRCAGKHAEARAAYAIAARRFDDTAARAAIVETYFEEGRPDDGARAALTLLARHRGTALRGRLERFVLQRLADRADLDRLADTCIALARSGWREVRAPVVNTLAGLFVYLRTRGDPRSAERLAAWEARTRKETRIWPEVRKAIDAWREALARDVQLPTGAVPLVTLSLPDLDAVRSSLRVSVGSGADPTGRIAGTLDGVAASLRTVPILAPIPLIFTEPTDEPDPQNPE